MGYAYFDTSGSLNGVDYSALLFGEINSFDIYVRQLVTVPEPSSNMLTLIGLLGLFIQQLLKGLGVRDIHTQSGC